MNDIEVIEDMENSNDVPIECNHRPTSRTTTLIFLNKQFLVYPPQVYGYCKCCGACLKFVKDEKDNWVEEKEENDKEELENVNV